MTIKNCIFDLGAVIINIDISLTVDAFTKLIPAKAQKIQDSILKTPLFDAFEKGLIDEITFRNSIREEFDADLSDNQIDMAWNALLLDFPKKRIDLLKNIQSRYRTFLLSNTNVLHWSALEEILHQTHQIKSLDLIFEKTYYSQNMRMRKPDAEIFEFVLQENGLNPQETIFFDDNLANIQSAQSLGLNTVQIKPNENDICDFFDANGLRTIAN